VHFNGPLCDDELGWIWASKFVAGVDLCEAGVRLGKEAQLLGKRGSPTVQTQPITSWKLREAYAEV